MKVKIDLIIIIALFVSCKSNQHLPTYKSISAYYQKELRSNVIKKDPIVLEDNNFTGLYSSIDKSLFKFKFIHYNSIEFIPKGFNYLNDFFGEDAENGVIIINKRIHFRCGGYYPKTVYLLDNKETTLKILDINKTKYYYLTQIEGLKDKNNGDVNITILTTKKPN